MTKNYMEATLKIAESKINQVEKGNNITEFNAWADTNYPLSKKESWQGKPYCYTFVSFCMIKSGLKIPFCASCPDGYNWYKAKDRIFKDPQRGDLAFFNWGKKISIHVGFVVKVNTDGSFYTIEANTSPSSTSGSQNNGQGVYMKLRQRWEIIGFGRPNYNQ